MAISVNIKLPQGWEVETETYIDEMFVEVTHLEAHLYNAAGDDQGLIDVSVAPMPQDETAYDQAFANYADMIGFSSEDEGADPIQELTFNSRKAYGFEAEDEDGGHVCFLAHEPKKGLISVLVCVGPDAESAHGYMTLAERGLRVR